MLVTPGSERVKIPAMSHFDAHMCTQLSLTAAWLAQLG